MATPTVMAARPQGDHSLLIGLISLTLSLAMTVVIIYINQHFFHSPRYMVRIYLACLVADYLAIRYLRRAAKAPRSRATATANAGGSVAVLLILIHFANYVMESASRSGWW